MRPAQTGPKKNERIEQALTMIAEIKKTYSVSIRDIARQAGLSYTTLMRWKRRRAAGKAAVGKPGPKKVEPLDLVQLNRKIRELDHGPKRSRGTGRLQASFSNAISRRELNRMIARVRRETNRQHADEMCHITWLKPNLAWAMDDCEKKLAVKGKKVYLHNLGDLCSRYKFRPLASNRLACGEAVAGHLSHLFDRFGAPLFLKRDNGGNLNHVAVDQAMAEAMVVPLNSPAYRAPYNGAIENTQGEFKTYLRNWDWKAQGCRDFTLLAETAAHDLNHRPRRSLKGENACRAYFGRQRISYTKRQRRDVYRWIRDLAVEVSVRVGSKIIAPAAWREAAKKWLVVNGMVKIQRAGKVLPDFPSKWCHN